MLNFFLAHPIIRTIDLFFFISVSFKYSFGGQVVQKNRNVTEVQEVLPRTRITVAHVCAAIYLIVVSCIIGFGVSCD